jgi:hypothetical protein
VLQNENNQLKVKIASLKEREETFENNKLAAEKDLVEQTERVMHTVT